MIMKSWMEFLTWAKGTRSYETPKNFDFDPLNPFTISRDTDFINIILFAFGSLFQTHSPKRISFKLNFTFIFGLFSKNVCQSKFQSRNKWWITWQHSNSSTQRFQISIISINRFKMNDIPTTYYIDWQITEWRYLLTSLNLEN